jgi:hypothetical protein
MFGSLCPQCYYDSEREGGVCPNGCTVDLAGNVRPQEMKIYTECRIHGQKHGAESYSAEKNVGCPRCNEMITHLDTELKYFCPECENQIGSDGFHEGVYMDYDGDDYVIEEQIRQEKDIIDGKRVRAESFGAESAFDRLEDEVADEYEEKGMSDKEAQKVGAAVAYKQGVKKYGKKIMSESARKGVSAKSLKRAEIGPHVPTRIGATTTQRGVVKTYDSIPAGDGHVVGQFTANMDYAPSGMYGAESLSNSIEKGFGAVLGVLSGLIISGFAMNAVSTLTSDDEN